MPKGTAYLLVVLILPAYAGGLPLSVGFKNDTVIDPDARSVPLMDVIIVRGDDAACRARLESSHLPLASRNIYSVLTERDVLAALGNDVALATCSFTWEGATTHQLHLAENPVDMEGLTRQAATALRAVLSARYQNVQIEPVQAAHDAVKAAAGAQFRIVPPDADRVSRRMAVDVMVSSPGRTSWRFPVWFSVSAQGPALSLSRNVGSHQELAGIRMQVMTADWATVEGTPVPVDFDFKGYESTRPLSTGELLTRGDIERRPDVIAGDTVAVQLTSAGIVLETSGIALQSGFVGDRILVRNQRSLSDITTRVDQVGHVEVLQ